MQASRAKAPRFNLLPVAALGLMIALAVLLSIVPSERTQAKETVTFSDVSAAAGFPASFLDTHGLEWGDYDNDGDPDLHISLSHEGATDPAKQSAVYRNNGDGTFTDVIAALGLGERFDRHGCAWGDYNNDGYLDFVCSSGGGRGESLVSWDRLWVNCRNGAFSEVGRIAGLSDNLGRGRTATWLDYDKDLDLDLFIANETRSDGPNRLWRNDGGAFTDVSAAAGLAVVSSAHGASVADYDNDGDADIAIATASDGTKLYRNNGDGTFADTAASSGVTDNGEGLGWGDYDNDGDLDLYMARIGGANNGLFRNNGDGTFTDVANASKVVNNKSRSASWADFDNDGDLDLFVVNANDPATGLNKPDALYLNQGDGTFIESAAAAGVAGPSEGWGDTAAWADYNDDGFIDLVVANSEDHAPTGVYGPTVLYQNNGNSNHWLKLSLRTGGANFFAIGSKVWITVSDQTQYRELTDQVSSRHMQNEQIVHFGVGAATVIDEVRVQWPDGEVDTFTGIAADQTLDVRENPGSPTPAGSPPGCSPAPVFDDVSASAGLRTADEKSFGMLWADYDNDGDWDLYVGRHGGGKNDLYRNRGDGSFQIVSNTPGIRMGGDRHDCVWGDLNKDGLIDLFCAVSGNDHVLINQGDGTFANQSKKLGFGKGSGRAANLLDYDRDGRLDVLFGDAQKVRLFRNTGTKFQIVAEYGKTGNEGPKSESTADYNNDGFTDAFIAQFPSANPLLMKGTGSGLVDSTAESGLVLDGPNSGTWADYDNDGDLDLFVTHWRYYCCYRPLKLFQNQGDGTFVDVTDTSGIDKWVPARAGLWGDFNNDGWLDLFIVNGMTNSDGVNRPDQMYLNKGDGTFRDVSAVAGTQGPSQGSGDSASWADYDNDGDLDIVVGNGSGDLACDPNFSPYCLGPDKLYRNQGNDNYSFQTRLIANNDTFGYGTKATLTYQFGNQYRELNDGMVGKSQLPQVLHFGLGSDAVVDSLAITWPDGSTETYLNLLANSAPITIKQGVGIVSP